jgi:hypothetical protein
VHSATGCDPGKHGEVTTYGSVTVIDDVTNSTTNIFDLEAFGPNGIVVNTASDKIYVTNGNTSTGSGDGGVTVIDGSTNSFIHVTDPNANTTICTSRPRLGSDLAVDPKPATFILPTSAAATLP